MPGHAERCRTMPNMTVAKGAATCLVHSPAMPTTPTRRRAPLAIDAETFRTLGHTLVDRLAELIDTVPSRRVTPDESPSQLRQAFDLHAPLPETGTDPATL